MSTGPNEPEQPEEVTKTVMVNVLKLVVLRCSTCKKDSLFAVVHDSGAGKMFHFCSRCGEYFEIKSQETEHEG